MRRLLMPALAVLAAALQADSTAAASAVTPTAAGGEWGWASLAIALMNLAAALIMLYYARQMSRWTGRQIHPALVCLSGQARWYQSMPNRIEVKLDFLNPGASMVRILSWNVAGWDGMPLAQVRSPWTPDEAETVKTGTPIAPYSEHETTLVLPFSHLPGSVSWDGLHAHLGPTENGVRLVVRVTYLTGPRGEYRKETSFCFRLWGSVPAADGYLIGIEQSRCGPTEKRRGY
jgi:hypothetical protein